jgi:hypothetical protein
MVGSIVASRLRNTPLFALAWPWPPICAFNTGFTTNCFYDFEIRKTNSTLKNKHLKYHTALSIFIILCKHYGISYCVLSWSQASLWNVVSRFLMHCWVHYWDLPVLLGRLIWLTDAAVVETDPVPAIFYSQGANSWSALQSQLRRTLYLLMTPYFVHLSKCHADEQMQEDECDGTHGEREGAHIYLGYYPVVISGV